MRRPFDIVSLGGSALATLLLLAGGLVGCERTNQNERLYTVYVDMEMENDATDEGRGPTGSADENAPAVTGDARVTPTPTATPVVEAPAPKVNPLEKRVKGMYQELLVELQRRALMPDDVSDGASRLEVIRRYLREKDYRTTENLIRSFKNDLGAIEIDEIFITKKNTRLLSLIQELSPTGLAQQKIDAESVQINQLLERADFEAINRRLNDLFEYVESLKR